MLINNWKNFVTEVSKLIARTWIDSQYRESFMANPKSQLLSAGFVLPDDLEVQLDQYTNRWKIEPSLDLTRVILTIGFPPKPYELDEEELRIAQNIGFSNYVPKDVAIFCCCCWTRLEDDIDRVNIDFKE
jgi:hypothetical protein